MSHSCWHQPSHCPLEPTSLRATAIVVDNATGGSIIECGTFFPLGLARMNRNTTEMERAVARALRDSLEKLQRTTDEVNQAIGDLMSACSSARPSNSLPHMLRAQTSAAALAASLDVLARFITSALQPDWRASFAQPESERSLESLPEPEQSTPAQMEAAEPPPAVAAPPIERPGPREMPVNYDMPEVPEPAPAAVEETLRTVASETEAFEQVALPDELPAAAELAPSIEPEPPADHSIFDVATLPASEQELHRRANRVAKVSMQDIKMLRPGEVQLGKESNDICVRLRDDIERAHREYERRFHAIHDHPVDYFYAWMVEILGEGDPRALGEYPYPSPVARR
jgi:hypothetical protein